MLHRNYVYDCERRYQKALADGIVDTETRNLYEQFQQAKRNFERSSEEQDRGKKHLRMGMPLGWHEAETAKRACNQYETEMMTLARRISDKILKLKNK